MLEIQLVSKRYSSGHYGVKDFSLTQRSGVLGLLGPNGAGKTTLMQLIATLTKPSVGAIFFDGIDLLKEPEALRMKLGFLPQDFGVYDNLTALEFLTYIASLKGVRSKSKITEMLELVNLHSVMHRNAASFSGGMRQRLGIAQALINDPKLLIVDEPTAGLDPEERVRFRNILSDIGQGKLVILSTHIVSDIESIATDIAIMKAGTLLVHESPENLMLRAKGRVWEFLITSHDFESLRASLKVSSAVRKADGIFIRVVSNEKPHPNASLVEPSLEDAFLYVMNFSQNPSFLTQ
ncbi:MAG: ABC transporter ATP-binding protein [Chloroherpetonaceae bacterium]|nr:ABC transporter ATP-binding protein [Chloroherpetonaceae bacterium]